MKSDIPSVDINKQNKRRSTSPSSVLTTNIKKRRNAEHLQSVETQMDYN